MLFMEETKQEVMAMGFTEEELKQMRKNARRAKFKRRLNYALIAVGSVLATALVLGAPKPTEPEPEPESDDEFVKRILEAESTKTAIDQEVDKLTEELHKLMDGGEYKTWQIVQSDNWSMTKLKEASIDSVVDDLKKENFEYDIEYEDVS